MNEYLIGGSIALLILGGIAYAMLRKRNHKPSGPTATNEPHDNRRTGDRTP